MTCEEAGRLYREVEEQERNGTGPWMHTISWSREMEAHRYHGCWWGQS